MADLAADRKELAQLEKTMASLHRRIRVKELRESIAEKQALLCRTQTELQALQTELNSLLDGEDGSQDLAPAIDDALKSSMSVAVNHSSADTNDAAVPSVDEPEIQQDAEQEKPIDHQLDGTQTLPNDEEDDTHPTTPPLRSTRLSTRSSGLLIDSPEKAKAILEQLKDKKSSICETREEGVFVDISCHICGVNMPRQPRNVYVNNRYDLAGLRSHYRSCHKVSLLEEGIYQICTKTELTDQDIRDILNKIQPANEMLRDRDGAPPKKGRSKSKADGDVSTLSAAQQSENSPNDGQQGFTVPQNERTSTLDTEAVPAPAAAALATENKLKRKEVTSSDDEECVPLVSQRPRLSDSFGADEMSSPTMQARYCQDGEDGEYCG